MDSAVVVFTKVPIPGLVKTRLTQNTCLTEQESAKLAEAMLKDTIILISKSNAEKIYLGYFPNDEISELKKIILSVREENKISKIINFELLLQTGNNFDQRFGSIVAECFKDNISILIILGADLPYLDPIIINRALQTLVDKFNEKPIVIGPSNGGGIYLLGITKSFNPLWFAENNLFEGGMELYNFTSLSRKYKIPVISLTPYGDIDLEEDLVSLISYIELVKNSKQTIGFHFPYYTSQVIEELGLYIIEAQDQTRRRKIAKIDDK
ncbi:MAG: DUF2064 domain-containing protein [Candidatus Thorarchaeota archaeon]